MLRRATLVALAAGTLLGASAPTATATPRYAAPAGSGTSCTSASPCDAKTAIQDAQDNDEVILAAGTHKISGYLFNQKKIEVHGEAGAARPLISLNDSGFQLAGRATIRHVAIAAGNSPGGQNDSVPFIFNGELMEDVTVQTNLNSACGVSELTGASWTVTVRNSTCSTFNGAAIYIGQGAANQTVNLRNVTAWGTVSGLAIATGSGNASSTVNVTNSILRPGITGSAQGTVTLKLSHDNYGSKGSGSGLVYDDDSTSSTGNPLLADTTHGDFHQLAASPTVGAGSNDAANGSTDFDGDLRTIGASTDVGADEYAPPPGAVTADATGVGQTDATPRGIVTPNGAATVAYFEWGTTDGYGNSTPSQALSPSNSPMIVSAQLSGLTPSTTYHFRVVATHHGGTAFGADQTFTTTTPAPPTGNPGDPGDPGNPGDPGGTLEDTLAPVVESFRLTNRKFQVTSDGTPVAARAKRGSAFRFSLSEPAAVTIVIERAAPGVKSGKSCLKPSKRAKGRHCTRYIKVGELKRSGIEGANSVPFSGRIGRRALEPGDHRASIRARDAAGNASEKETTAFEIAQP
jgi:hypothetical protein